MESKYWILIALIVVLLLVLYRKQENNDVKSCKYDSDCPSGKTCNTDLRLCF